MSGASPGGGPQASGAAEISGPLLRFAHRLRAASVPVSMVETIDAAHALERIDPADRGQFREALRATMVKRAEHAAIFDSLFDLSFSTRRSRTDLPDEGAHPGSDTASSGLPPSGRRAVGAEGASTDMLRALLDALRANDDVSLARLASEAVDRYGGVRPDRDASERYYLYRVLRAIDLARILRQAVEQERAGMAERDPLSDRLAFEEQSARMQEFRWLIAQEIRRRLAEGRGEPTAAGDVQERPIEDVDFLTASPSELQEMRRAIRPLARKLAARVAKRRKHRGHGRLDVRRTIRRSLSSGGVPLDPAFRRPRASKPDLYLLCDISGSVAEFARFTMSLLQAMRSEFSRIRLFVFVDGIDEVTDIFTEGSDLAPRNLLYRTKAIAADGHSDYGGVFELFWERYGHAGMDPRATVIVTGDGRNNYREPSLGPFRSMVDRARHVYWLNPEPRAEWNTTDSIMDLYAGSCEAVFEVRNLRQLASFVLEIA